MKTKQTLIIATLVLAGLFSQTLSTMADPLGPNGQPIPGAVSPINPGGAPVTDKNGQPTPPVPAATNTPPATH